jgi:hypothetical protein
VTILINNCFEDAIGDLTVFHLFTWVGDEAHLLQLFTGFSVFGYFAGLLATEDTLQFLLRFNLFFKEPIALIQVDVTKDIFEFF